jgi:hypothetical protein
MVNTLKSFFKEVTEIDYILRNHLRGGIRMKRLLKLFLIVLIVGIGLAQSVDVNAAKYNKKKLYKAFYGQVTGKLYVGQYTEYCIKDINGDGIPELIARYIPKITTPEIVNGLYASGDAGDYRVSFYDKKKNKITGWTHFRGGPNNNKHYIFKTEFNKKTKEIRTYYCHEIVNTDRWALQISIYKYSKKSNAYIYGHRYADYGREGDDCNVDGDHMTRAEGIKLIDSKYDFKNSVDFEKLKYTKKKKFIKKLKKGMK